MNSLPFESQTRTQFEATQRMPPPLSPLSNTHRDRLLKMLDNDEEFNGAERDLDELVKVMCDRTGLENEDILEKLDEDSRMLEQASVSPDYLAWYELLTEKQKKELGIEENLEIQLE